MKITKISVYAVDLPLDEVYYLSGKREFTGLDTTIVKVETDSGIHGVGETCPWGVTYLPAFAKGARAGLEELAPVLLGKNPLHLYELNRTMDYALPGHLYIKSALDMACWDILGKHCNLPLYSLLGGKFQASVALQGSCAMTDPEDMVRRVRNFRKRGYTMHTIKIGGDSVDHSLSCLNAILADRAAGEQFTFDANGHWRPSEAAAVMNSTKDAQVFFEQVCKTLEECRVARGLTRHAMTMDECVETMEDLQRAHGYGCLQGFGLKIARVGGLTKAREMRDFCVRNGVMLNVEVTGGSVIADTAAVHLALATPKELHRATWDCTQLHSVVTARGGMWREGGRAGVGEAVGLGVELVEEVVGKPVAVYEM